MKYDRLKQKASKGPFEVETTQENGKVFFYLKQGGSYIGDFESESEARSIAHTLNTYDALLEALVGMTEHYCDLINSGDAGNWNPENEIPVIASREALKAAKEPSS